MEADIIQKYKDKGVQDLLRIATTWFNRYIRLRDKGKPCISCKEYKKLEAGHFYSAGHYSSLKFNENNVHGQCRYPCNYWLSGNLNHYRINIVERIGVDGLKELDDLAAISKRKVFKWDRFSLIEIIEIYKQKVKKL